MHKTFKEIERITFLTISPLCQESDFFMFHRKEKNLSRGVKFVPTRGKIFSHSREIIFSRMGALYEAQENVENRLVFERNILQ